MIFPSIAARKVNGRVAVSLQQPADFLVCAVHACQLQGIFYPAQQVVRQHDFDVMSNFAAEHVRYDTSPKRQENLLRILPSSPRLPRTN